jgi:hypothetical protein
MYEPMIAIVTITGALTAARAGLGYWQTRRAIRRRLRGLGA